MYSCNLLDIYWHWNMTPDDDDDDGGGGGGGDDDDDDDDDLLGESMNATNTSTETWK